MQSAALQKSVQDQSRGQEEVSPARAISGEMMDPFSTHLRTTIKDTDSLMKFCKWKTFIQMTT
jgi:hypothetical protein